MKQDPMKPSELRRIISRGDYRGNTSGHCPGFVQCNLVILPTEAASDFKEFCHLNPKPCPLLAVSSVAGDYSLPELGDIDVRTDLPSYRIFKDGLIEEEVTDITSIWNDRFFAFALGCSFSFEEALLEHGLEIRNISQNVNVPMYVTNLECKTAGSFAGNMVVSMRPFIEADAIQAAEISSRFPSVHGAPIHIGDPAEIGIESLELPDFGESVVVKNKEIPVFWACGVTPQVALQNAKLPFAITHTPGCMLVTDLKNDQLAES
jgi:Uncharacterized conserved protein